MADDMPKPRFWVSLSVKGDQHFVHVRDGERRQTVGPFASHHAAAKWAKREWQLYAPREMAEAA